MYDRDYYEDGIKKGVSLYENYRGIPEKTIPFAHEVVKHLGLRQGYEYNYDDSNFEVVDYGCAKGYLVKALKLLGILACGCDISEYAISNCDPDVKNFVKLIENDKPHQIPYSRYLIAKDVLEHISYRDIKSILEEMAKRCDNILVIVPLADEGKYIIPEYELDKTHIIRENLTWWTELIRKFFPTIKHSGHKLGRMKEEWRKHSVYGNGFIIAQRG